MMKTELKLFLNIIVLIILLQINEDIFGINNKNTFKLIKNFNKKYSYKISFCVGLL